MAKSRFEYVKNYELPDPLLPNTYLVIRVDGRGFHKFSDQHDFEKPNDVRALELMNRAAQAVMDEFGDVVLGYGESDEYSFLMRRATNLYSRRSSKINSAVCSIFTSAYVFYWPTYFPNLPLKYPPTFDSRIVLYPSDTEIRDYFSWRQADTHINNLYNTCFWALVHDGMTTQAATKELHSQYKFSKDKHELLFSRFQVNYNHLPAKFRKGSILLRRDPAASASDPSAAAVTEGVAAVQLDSTEPGQSSQAAASGRSGDSAAGARAAGAAGAGGDAGSGSSASSKPVAKPAGATPAKGKLKPFEGTTGEVEVLHVDMIKKEFWDARPWLLA